MISFEKMLVEIFKNDFTCISSDGLVTQSLGFFGGKTILNLPKKPTHFSTTRKSDSFHSYQYYNFSFYEITEKQYTNFYNFISHYFYISPWFKSGTIRDNILLGHTDSQQGFGHRTKLYEKVIRECGLLEDLQRLPEGDLTWVKKNGENLSGGQRQRISLARAVFKNAGTYFLDDPMSAIGKLTLLDNAPNQVVGGIIQKRNITSTM